MMTFYNTLLVTVFHLLSLFAGANLAVSLRQRDVLLAGFVVMTEIAAIGAALLIFERMQPRTLNWWPPRTMPPLEVTIPDGWKPHPCRKLLDEAVWYVGNQSPRQRQVVKDWLEKCREKSPDDAVIPSIESLLDLFREDDDE